MAMPSFNQRLDPGVTENRLRELIAQSDYQPVDPEGSHHVLSSGLHGRKVDFDKIPTASADFDKWVDINAEFYQWLFGLADLGNIALVGVANGTNRLVGPMAEAIGKKHLQAFQTLKNPFRLDAETTERLVRLQPSTMIINEDVSTTGEAVAEAFGAVHRVYPEIRSSYAVISFKRSKLLGKLPTSIDDYSIVCDDETYPTYTPQQCRAVGHCAAGWEVIERSVA